MPAVLNLNNEVVKLRAEVKRVRVLIIRKLIRQITVLEKKKGSQEDLEKYRRRAARLLEEIKELKVTVPDKVTKTALQKDISFEKVCKNKEASLADRAIARIATHPQFNKKIQNLKDAIKAFKDERINTINSEEKAKKNPDDLQDEPQADSKVDCHEALDDEEKKLKEEDVDKILEKPHEDSSVEEVLLKMRREAKTVRVLVLGKLTRKLGVLKKKKVDESEMKSNQDAIAQLMKDIQALRSLKPDEPTIRALEQNIELEKVLQNHQASPKDRVIALIITQSRFINKLQKVKNRIEENKAKAEEQMKKEGPMKEGVLLMEEANDDIVEEDDDSKDDDDEDDDEGDENDENDEDDEGKKDKDEEEKEKDEDDHKEDDNKVVEETMSTPSFEILKPAKSADTEAIKLPPIKDATTTVNSKPTEEQSKVKSQNATTKMSSKKSFIISKSETKLPMKVKETEMENTVKPQTKAPSNKEDEESDLSDDEEEKEYFDDSTEERFRKQSSQSEESEDDDFFLSKVSKFKKRKSSQAKVQGKQSESQTISNPEKTNPGKLESVFCTTLSKSSTSAQKDKHGSHHDGPRPPRFQKKGPDGRMKPSVYKDPGTDRKAVPFKPNKQTFKYAGKRQEGPPGAGRGRSQFEQHQDFRGPPGKTSNPSQQSLHPSWEASRKRKEQQAQITAFQGKKIRFDDDD